MELLEWQKPLAEQATRELKEGCVFALGACTGAGKTYVCCETIRRVGLPTLVIAPKVSLTQWRQVVDGMGVKDLVIDVINPEQISKPSGCRYYTRDGGWQNLPYPCLLVVDEIHRGCSSHDSVTTKAVVKFGAKKVRPLNKLIALSATMADSPFKLAVLGYWMGFHRYVEASWYDWLRAHGCSYVDIGWGRSRKRVFAFTTNRKRAMETMASIRRDMGTRFLSVTPDDIPGFPENTVETVLVDLAKKDHDALVKAYEEMPDQFRKLGEDDMVRTLRLRQQAEFCKAQVLADMAADLVEDEGVSVFIAVNFTETRKRIGKRLSERGVPHAEIYGGQSDSERQAGINSFQANVTTVMVGMMQACSVALSLHDVHHARRRVSLISPGYSASELVQALGRIRRVGGTAAVQKIVFAADSVEERVERTVGRKVACIDTLNDRELMR